MLRRVILALVALVIAYVYLGALGYAIAIAAALPLPRWWMAAFSSSGPAVLSWSTISHTIAVILVSIPFAWVLVLLYKRFSLYVAVAVGVATWLVIEVRFVVDAWYFPRLMTIWFADTLVFVLALPALAWLFARLPSNNRWRGP